MWGYVIAVAVSLVAGLVLGHLFGSKGIAEVRTANAYLRTELTAANTHLRAEMKSALERAAEIERSVRAKL